MEERWLPKIAMGFLIYTIAGGACFPEQKAYIDRSVSKMFQPKREREISKPARNDEEIKLIELLSQDFVHYYVDNEGKPLVIRAENFEADDLMKESVGYIASSMMANHANEYSDKYEWYLWKWRRGWEQPDRTYALWGELVWDHYRLMVRDRLTREDLGKLTYIVKEEMAMEMRNKARERWEMSVNLR